MSWITCILCCNETKENEECLLAPEVIYGYVRRVLFGNKLMVKYNIKGIVYNYYVILNNIKILPCKNSNAAHYLNEMILNKDIRLENITFLDYSEMTADVYYDNIHINKKLIENGYAVIKNDG